MVAHFGNTACDVHTIHLQVHFVNTQKISNVILCCCLHIVSNSNPPSNLLLLFCVFLVFG